MLRSEFEDHILHQCPIVKCVYCGMRVRRENEKEHVDQLCTEVDVDCNYAQFGCPTRCKRGDMLQHMNRNVTIHLELVKLSHMNLEDKINKVESKLERMKKKHEKDYDGLLGRIRHMELMDVVSEDEQVSDIKKDK